MNKYLLVVLLIVLITSCKTNTSNNLCLNEKAFISIQDFYNLAFELDEPKIQPCHILLFDTLKSFAQIDSFRNELCKNGKIDCSGCISLKYVYKHDTIYIPVFNAICQGCYISIAPLKAIKIRINKDTLLIFKDDFYKPITLNSFKDTLENIFSKSIGEFSRLMLKRKPYINNIDSIKSWKNIDYSIIRVLNIEINDDSQIKQLKNYIDIAYNIYIQQLQNQIENTYHSNICELSRSEFKIFVRELYFSIKLQKYNSVIFIEPL